VRTDRAPVPFGTRSVRLDAGAPVTTEDVLEVAREVDPTVAEAWMIDRGQTFSLTGKELVSLADRGMPSRVIDMLVAISNPATFTMLRNDAQVSVSDLAAQDEPRRGERAPTYNNTSYGYGVTGMGWMFGGNAYYGWGPYDYRYGYQYRYGYGNTGVGATPRTVKVRRSSSWARHQRRSLVVAPCMAKVIRVASHHLQVLT
jgi:hypothetical protein